MSDDVLADYTAEQAELQDLLAGLDEADWSRPTPAAGWDVRDQVSHLADTEDLAHDVLTGPPGLFMARVAEVGVDDFTEAGCRKGRAMTPAEVLAWWASSAERCRAALAAAPRDQRVGWGLGMGWRAFVTARLMEHWAHGLDVRAALGRPALDTDRIRHVAWIGASAVPYALSVAEVAPPEGRTLRFELDGPGGERWAFGPEDATDRVTGPAGEWCRLAVQRATLQEAKNLVADGPLAELALGHARAFL
jgi:uncharacterized protein (TIGR03084 family)